MTSQPVYSEHSSLNCKSQPQILFGTFTQEFSMCWLQEKSEFSLWISKKKKKKGSFTSIFPLLHNEESSPQVTSKTVNRHALLFKKKKKCLYFYVSSSWSCPLSLVMLDYSMLSSQGKTQIHS